MKKRAMKKWIPEGLYCHGALSYIREEKGMPILIYKRWCRNMVGDRCRYMGVSKKDDILLWDSCKICGIKDEW